MSHHCTGEPISWLRLEQLHLGEVGAAEQSAIEDHLAACPACHDAWARIEGDERTLAPLPARESAPAAWYERVLSRRWLPAGLAAAAAAALAVFLLPSDPGGPSSAIPPARVTLKGGDLAISLVREREGAVAEDPARYLPGDRFEVLLTSPNGAGTSAELIVYEAGEASFPLRAIESPRAGNRLPLPGAFRLTGDRPVTVCLVLGERLPSRDELASYAPSELPEPVVCAALDPAR